MKQFLIFSLFLIVVAAYSDGSVGQAPDQHVSPPQSPPPVAQDYDSSRDPDLEGRDVDINGIRDDIDDWLNNKFHETETRRNWSHLARQIQIALSNENGTAEDYARYSIAPYCINRTTSPNLEVAELFSISMNTQIRARALGDWERSGINYHISFPSLQDIETYCP